MSDQVPEPSLSPPSRWAFESDGGSTELGPSGGSRRRHRPGFNIHDSILDDEGDEALSFTSTSNWIDNSVLVYIPMKLKCGVKVHCRPDVLARCPAVLRDLNDDVEGCLAVLPNSVHPLVRRTSIWINTTYYYGPREKLRNVNHSTTHHHVGWLYWSRDKPEKTGSIEIYNCFEYQAMRLHWNGSGLLLHEFCHVLHQLTLHNGLNNDTVIDAFQSATQSGLYDRTLRRDWAGLESQEDMAYCMVNHKEFFAEISVAFLAEGYSDVAEKDPKNMELCSPPLMAPQVAERVRMKVHTVEGLSIVPGNESHCPLLPSPEQSVERRAPKAKGGFFWPFTGRKSEQKSIRVPHCNKFYPFTKRQFQNHDPELYAVFEDLWKQIAMWNDEEDESPCARFFRKCWPI